MKKLLILCFALIIGGCGGRSDDSTTTSTDNSSTDAAKVRCTPPAVKNGNICVTPPPPTPTCTAPQVLQNGICVTPTTSVGPFGQDGSVWTLTFSDEFEGSALDTTKFNDHLWYDSSDPVKNYSVSGGSLKIWPDRGFVSRNIDTDGKFSQLYGYFEIEAKLPYGKGTWPAFWLYAHPCDRTGPADKCRPEIDIFEAYAGGGVNSGWSTADLHPNNFGITIHEANGDYSFHDVPYATKMRDFAPYRSTPVDLSAGWHKYGMKWEPSGITFYFDGQQLGPKWNDTAGYFNQPMYVILSLAFGSASGTPDSTTPTGPNNALDVRYMRVWKAK